MARRVSADLRIFVCTASTLDECCRPNNVQNTVVNGVEKDEDVTVRLRPAFCADQG